MPIDDGFAGRVVRWQREHGRHSLPWQASRDPYRVWLSEVMLQQTQVVTVIDYYARFLARFPDIAALADAPLDDVLALWSGLGYYSRARNLHRCALAVMAEHGGSFPSTSAVLATLPGIGRSTAAAIAAFCFGERAAILDGNVKRVLTRAIGFKGDLALAAEERALWKAAEALLPAQQIERYTQGMMDLGATVCLARKPLCLLCPLAADCVARREGRPEVYPLKTRRIKRSRRQHALLWLADGERLWLTQRPPKGVWAGLWSLPEFDSLDAVQEVIGASPGSGELLPVIEHALTHFDWTLQPFRWCLPSRVAEAGRAGRAGLEEKLAPGRWVTRSEALAMGLPAPLRKLLAAA